MSNPNQVSYNPGQDPSLTLRLAAAATAGALLAGCSVADNQAGFTANHYGNDAEGPGTATVDNFVAQGALAGKTIYSCDALGLKVVERHYDISLNPKPRIMTIRHIMS